MKYRTEFDSIGKIKVDGDGFSSVFGTFNKQNWFSK